MKKVIFFSPHPDDIALSLGGLLGLNYNHNFFYPVLYTVYTKSNHAPYLKIVDSVAISEIRIKEDKSYTLSIGGEYIYGEQQEGLLRGYPNIESLFDSRNIVDEDLTYDRVFADIDRILTVHQPYLTFFPSGIGGHIEHRILNTIGRLCGNVLFYEDLPYAADYSNEALNRYYSECYENIIIVSSLNSKIENLRTHYPSQIGSKEVANVKKYHFKRETKKMLGHVFCTCDRAKHYNSEIVWGSKRACEKFLRIFEQS